MSIFVSNIYQILDCYAFLMIASFGLAIIYGMMGIINMAHGAFIMLGAYATTMIAAKGTPFGIAVILGACLVSIFGGILDRILMFRLYNRPLDSIAVTWGLDLILSTGMLIVMGPTLPVVPAPFGVVSIAGVSFQVYRLLIILISILLPIVMYLIFSKTRYGIESRATMMRPISAGLLGINTNRMFTITFMLGSGLAGLAGGIYSCTMTVSPSMGSSFQMQSFVTVVVGGLNPLIGTLTSSGFLGLIQGVVCIMLSSFFGRMALLLVAILVLRVLPGGTSSLVSKIKEDRIERKGLQDAK